MRRLVAVVAVLVCMGGFGTAAQAATLRYPGCGATLLKCMRHAANGSTIRVTTNRTVRLPAGVVGLKKALSIVAARGYEPTIRSASATTYLQFTLAGGSSDVAVRDLRLVNVEISIEFTGGTGHRALFERNRVLIVTGSNGERGFSVFTSAGAQSSVTARDNGIVMDGTGIDVGLSGGRSIFTGNRITGLHDSANGISVQSGGSRSARALIANNVVSGVERCWCGNPYGIGVDAQNTSTLDVRILNNTVHDVGAFDPGERGWGITVLPPAATASIRAAIFNNIVTNAGTGLLLYNSAHTTVTGDANNTMWVGTDSVGSYDVGTTTHVDPVYVGDRANDFRLRASSTLRDAGQTCVPGQPLPRADAAGKFRVAGSSVDVGAFEYGSAISGSVRGRNRTGTSGADTLLGTAGRDVLCGLGGADHLRAAGGNDYVYGGSGDDVIRGGHGNDRLFGGAGDDHVFGEVGADRLDIRDGVASNDSADGGPGTDVCLADTGDTTTSC